MNLIVSVSLNGVIGCGGKLAHPISEDLRRFKKLTSGGAVVMGSTTFSNDLKLKPLPNRENYVLTKNQSYVNDGTVTFINNIQEVRTKLPIWVIGGAKIYKLLLPSVSKMFVTHIHKPLVGDSFFQPNWEQWELENLEEKNYFSYAVYCKK
ncbi:MAG: dihydrofolate reductase [Sphaerospermopsis kisseleviana]